MLATRATPGTRPVAARRVSVVANAVKLYSHPRSRGRIVEWYLQELGLKDAEIVNLDLAEKEHKKPEFLAVHPFGQVPALEDGGLKLFESGALLTYLADKYGALDTPEKRAKAAQWTLFANSTLANALFVEQFREKAMPNVMGTLDQLLGQRPFIEGDAFSVSDVAVGSYLLYVPAFLPDIDLTQWPNVAAYMKRLAERPACAATVASRATEAAGEKKAK